MHCSEIADRFLKTLNSYLKSNGPRLLSIASVSGQSEVKLSTHGLMRYYSPSPEHPRFADLLLALLNCGFEGHLRGYDFKTEVKDGEVYIRIPLDYVRDLIRYRGAGRP